MSKREEKTWKEIPKIYHKRMIWKELLAHLKFWDCFSVQNYESRMWKLWRNDLELMKKLCKD